MCLREIDLRDVVWSNVSSFLCPRRRRRLHLLRARRLLPAARCMQHQRERMTQTHKHKINFSRSPSSAACVRTCVFVRVATAAWRTTIFRPRVLECLRARIFCSVEYDQAMVVDVAGVGAGARVCLDTNCRPTYDSLMNSRTQCPRPLHLMLTGVALPLQALTPH